MKAMGMISKVYTFFGFYTLKQDELGVILFLGSYQSSIGPGLHFAIPFLHSALKTKASIQTIDLPDQKIVLSGNISVKISGSVNFRVGNSRKAILEVESYAYSLRQLALTTISDVLGIKTIEQIRREKKSISDEIENIISRTASKWGLSEVDIRLTDAEMDENLLRAMMRETEAEKEANAIKIKAESDRVVSSVFAEAAATLAKSPGSMTLRILQALTDMSNSKSTIVVPIPIDLLTNLKGADEVNVPKKTIRARVYKKADKDMADCPHCHAKYKVGNVIARPEKYDEDDSEPGIQLTCKKCQHIFALEESA